MWNMARSPRPRPRPVARRQTGFGLLEVLISVVVLSIGLLGLSALLVNAIKNNQSSLQRTQATMLTYLMFDAMRANRADAANGLYHLAKTCTVPAEGSTLVSRDHYFWMDKLKKNIGNENTTCGEVNCPKGASTCTVRVYWKDNRDDANAEEKFEVATRL